MCHLIFSMLFFLIFCVKLIAGETTCGKWKQYKDDKCLKIFSNIQNFSEATNTCNHYNSTLVTITSLDEQRFVENYLFAKHKVIENVWTGFRYKCVNDFDASFTNWSEGSPKNKSELCIQISADELSIGKWSDISCSKRNLALCQKTPKITIELLQRMLISTRKQLENTIQQFSIRLENSSKELLNTRKELESKSQEIEDFFRYVHFKTFIENNTRKAFIYPNKNQSVSRNDAINICDQKNAKLVDIESLDKQLLVESFLRQIDANYNDFSYWISGFGDGVKYKWLNSGNVLTYTNWGSGQPQNDKSFVHIVSNIDVPTNDGKWFSSSPVDTNNFFCEITFND